MTLPPGHDLAIVDDHGDRVYRTDGRPASVDDLVRHFARTQPHYFNRYAEEAPPMEPRPEVTAVQAALDALEHELNPEARRAELEEALKPYAKDGPWAHAPASAKRETAESVAALQKSRADAALLQILQTADAAAPLVEADVTASMNVPDPLTAYVQARDGVGVTGSEGLQLGILGELKTARFDRTLRGAMPAALLAAYQDAVARRDVHEVAYIERHGTALAGRTDDVDQITALHVLNRTIEQTRAARVPDHLRTARDVIAKARAAERRASDRSHSPSLV